MITYARWGHIGGSLSMADLLAVLYFHTMKVDPAKRRISLGMKQLQPHPWDLASEKYKAGERVHGTLAFDMPRGDATLLMSDESDQTVTALRVPD